MEGRSGARVVWASGLQLYSNYIPLLHVEVTEKKRHKYQRDCKDYNTGRVYSLKEERTRQRWGGDEDGLPPPVRERHTNTGKYPFTPREQGARPHDHYQRKAQYTPRLPRYLSSSANSSSYNSTEENDYPPTKHPADFLELQPICNKPGTERRNPQYPFPREAYPQRDRSHNNRR
ncbi:hypothetical protein XELAEV_18040339mg [Xenopus laevis]|uniref:Uncharacterized protein n=1 Tax=Xenopus laevis TaxID=8355 RepID=A0A974H992_XENLA|nr:hypothetical protein XELAEV_18040339mg [Xenopus laevis]